MGTALVAIPIALALGAPVATYMIVEFGWRIMFMVLAAAGLLWLPAWLWLFSDLPKQSRFVNDAESAYISAGRGASDEVTNGARLTREDFRVLLTTPTLLASYWSYFVFGYLLFLS